MKCIITNQQTVSDVGETGLKGKVLVSEQDDVGFVVYDVHLVKDQVIELKPYKIGYNHTYYVMRGVAVAASPYGEEVQLGADDVLALNAETITTIKVKEDIRLSIGYVPCAPDQTPGRFIVRRLDDIVGTPKNVFWQRGYSRRLFVKADGFNIGITNTTLFPNFRSPLYYPNHVEAVLMFKGSGKYIWNGGEESQEFDEEKHDGTMILIDRHEQHDVELYDKGAEAICYFFPALLGHETHDFTKGDDNKYSAYGN
ncbi:unnamed protein product [Owenia fusiformis]|uniref:L-ectoine synthase n=1 Tax=Owenia fusiformis TaxID=6347 RepID=A0A8J1TBB8_OWEFU|nr:unnamed protein product [Owenia fusiformis]